jgi:XTP/dITP diphosphohydrolase
MKLLFATHNRKKLADARQILGQKGVEIEHLEVEYDEPRGEDTSEIARKSAERLYLAVKKPLFLDDSGLFVDALNGFPGSYSAFVYKRIGCAGILNLLKGKSSRKAFFKCSIAYADENGVKVFDGIVNGKIAESARGRGNEGYGYGPIFVPDGFSKTVAEMDDKENRKKNAISDRGKALAAFAKWISRKA